MKKVDTSKVWQGKHKPEKLEMKGFTISPPADPGNKENINISEKSRELVKTTKEQSNRDTTQPRNHDTTVFRYHDTIIQLVR